MPCDRGASPTAKQAAADLVQASSLLYQAVALDLDAKVSSEKVVTVCSNSATAALLKGKNAFNT